MKTIIAAISAAVFCASLAMPGIASANPQHEKMKSCNTDAKTKALKGQDRKDFMKTCLSAGGNAKAADEKALTPQQQKMKNCNADAKTKALKGQPRKDFMKTCLSS